MSLIIECQSKRRRRGTQLRPSLLDPWLSGDPWMMQCASPGLLVLDLCNHPVAVQAGTALEQASLNAWIAQLRRKVG